jgi:hypothetical protein
MSPDCLYKGDMIMLPKQGEMPTRNVLLTQAEPTEVYDADGNELYWVVWLGDDGVMQDGMILSPQKVTLIARREQ